MNNKVTLLDIHNLKTYYSIARGSVKAVDNVSFQVSKGESLGLAGESGCGKTTVALSIMRILPSGGKVVGGEILFNGTDLVGLDEEEMRTNVRWKGISIVFQGAMNALNPVYKISEQIMEAIATHEAKISKKEGRKRVENLLEMVGIDPKRADNYAHEFSGGMRQRALIAMSLACNPQLLIADEPGTALDVIVQAQVLRLLKELKSRLGLSMILITHDLSIVADICEKCAIMYAGKMAEYGDVLSLYKEPLHPYTQGLINAFPSIKGPKIDMISIPGLPPDLLNPPEGCRFHPRCAYAMDVCKKKEPPVVQASKGHHVACFLIGA